MTRRPAHFTQSDIARVLRAVDNRGGPARIDVKPDGTISIIIGLPEAEATATAPVDDDDSPVYL